jgi:hypothetical protein
MPEILALRRLKQEDHKFQVSQGLTVSALSELHSKTLSQPKQEQNQIL